MSKNKVIKEEKVDLNGEVTKNLLNSLLNGNKDDHYNHVQKNPIKVSTGSLILDQQVTLTEGIHRFVGYSGAGKSSEAFLVMKNFLEVGGEKRKAILVKSEGRLSDNIKNRSGINFTYDSENWNYGTCFVLETNLIEFMCSTLEALVKVSHAQGEKLFIVIDSIDGLKLKSDLDKDFGSERVAGVPLILKKYLSKLALPMQAYGVICIFISQVSSNIKIDPYSKEPPKMTSGGGGWALVHFANYILEFEARYAGDNILENPSAKYDVEKNKIIGHWTTVTIKKSDKENEFVKVKYPIKHGRNGGNSIWIEYEIVDTLLSWGLIKKSGAWLSFNDTISKELKEAGFSFDAQYQGIDNLRKFLEEHKDITDFFFKKLKDILGK